MEAVSGPSENLQAYAAIGITIVIVAAMTIAMLIVAHVLGPKRHGPVKDSAYESGMPKFTIVSWAGLFGPAKMPRNVVDRLNSEFTSAMKQADVISGMEKQAFVLSPSTPEQLGAHTREQMDSYRTILRAAGVQPE